MQDVIRRVAGAKLHEACGEEKAPCEFWTSTSFLMIKCAQVIKEDAKLKEEARSPQQLPPAMRPRPGSAVKRLWDDSSADATSPSKSRQVSLQYAKD